MAPNLTRGRLAPQARSKLKIRIRNDRVRCIPHWLPGAFGAQIQMAGRWWLGDDFLRRLRVRVYLKNNKTGLFFVSEGCWTESRGAAQDFKHSAAAVVTAHKHKLRNAIVVFVFEGGALDMCISIGEEELKTAPAQRTTQGQVRPTGPPAGGPVRKQGGLNRKDPASKRERDTLERL